MSTAVIPSRELSADDIAHYRQKGWVAARGFFSPAEAARLSQWTDEICALPEVPGRHMVYWENNASGRLLQRIEDFCSFHAGMDELVRQGRLTEAVAELLEAPPVLFKDKLNFKPPGGSGFVLHQDQQAGWSAYAPIFLTALISIDRAWADNGCLQIADMPRPQGLLGQEWKPLTPDELRGHKLMDVPTEPGDVLFFDSYVAHASEANRSDRWRRILYLTYNRLADGDHRAQYYRDKRKNFPPDVERVPGREYKFRV